MPNLSKDELAARKARYDRKYYLANKEKALAANRLYRIKHRDKLNAHTRKWHKENPPRGDSLTKKREANLRWYYRNRDSRIVQHAEWVKKNKKQQLEYSRTYESANREARAKKSAKWRRDNPEKYRATIEANRENARTNTHKRRAILRNSPEQHTTEELLTILSQHRKCCLYCGTNGTPDNPITRDHYIPLSKGGTNGASNIVPSCLSCNLRKSAKDPIQFLKSQYLVG